MVSAGLQIMGTALGLLGWIGAIVACALPMWKMTAFIGTNIVTAQITWEGIWMSCVVQSTGQMQCKVYDSMLALPQDLQAARALIVIAVVVGILGILLAVAGGKCTNCVEDERAKSKVGVVAGVVFVIAGLMCLVPVCWTANTIIRDFYNPLVYEAQKRELGASLYIGWGAAALMIIGGGLLCCNCPEKEDGSYTAKYKAARSQASAPTNKDYV
ncbi:claudin-4-like [Denticeps clupeoides]|uniref:claudin-4-like n=1 Tax=Denticeps clupeoides TaxID=299321 RepID=UPI0010A463E0|nr:claudin-4-like [Denticeps clupeoides]